MLCSTIKAKQSKTLTLLNILLNHIRFLRLQRSTVYNHLSYQQIPKDKLSNLSGALDHKVLTLLKINMSNKLFCSCAKINHRLQQQFQGGETFASNLALSIHWPFLHFHAMVSTLYMATESKRSLEIIWFCSFSALCLHLLFRNLAALSGKKTK